MTISEFNNLSTKKCTNTQYACIEKVYVFHPCISETQGKKQIAELYDKFGMRLILDMLPTAEKAAELEKEILQKQNELNELAAEMKRLKDGAA